MITTLRRPLVARLFGTVTQGVLSIYALLSLATVAALAAGGSFSAWALAPLLFDALWVRGFTARASFDETGLRTRFWVQWDHPWERISSITLQRLDNAMSSQAKGAPAIVVRTKGKDGDETVIVPALRCGRARRQFGSALLAAAGSRGVKTNVGSDGWDESVQAPSEPFA